MASKLVFTFVFLLYFLPFSKYLANLLIYLFALSVNLFFLPGFHFIKFFDFFLLEIHFSLLIDLFWIHFYSLKLISLEDVFCFIFSIMTFLNYN